MSQLTDLPAWNTLAEHQQSMADTHLRQLFADDPQRAERFSLRCNDILFDYSKQRINAQTRALLN